MTENQFFESIKWINNKLVYQDISRIFNSMGSHIFLEFGEKIEIVLGNGKKDFRKEWVLWVGNASWRITKDKKYIVASGEDLKVNIQPYLEKLLGKRFQSLQFLSQFLDAEFSFEGGYQLTTFFNWIVEDQWTIFLPNKTEVGIDYADVKEIKNVQSLAAHFPIIDTYKKIDLFDKNPKITKITYDKNDLPTFHCDNHISIALEICTWRLEKDNNYLIGYIDDDQNLKKKTMSALIGKNLLQIDVANSMMDARFQFEDGYTLKTFTCCRQTDQWKIYAQDKTLFSASIAITDDN